MALKEKSLDEASLALLEVIEDPIWFSEWMRSTNNGEINKRLHAQKEWVYRWYQKDLLTDKSKHIVLTGGRAIGKCQSGKAKVYTDQGYKKISELLPNKYFNAYCLDENMQLVVRRASVMYDKSAALYSLETESGRVIEATLYHPVLTQQGYKFLRHIKIGTKIGVVTKLPDMPYQAMFNWHEMRYLGYVFLTPWIGAQIPLKCRYKKQEAELKVLADHYNAYIHTNEDKTIELRRYNRYLRHKFNWVLDEIGVRNKEVTFIPDRIKREPNESIRIFLESLFSMWADFTQTSVSITANYNRLADDLQELLLRFGIESKIEKVESKYKITLTDYRAYYRFWNIFSIPGVAVGKLELPPISDDFNEHIRYETVTRKWKSKLRTDVYAVYVHNHNNYISDNVYVHNSLILEDKIIFEAVNNDIEFPVTPERLLTTANKAQLILTLGKLINRLTTSPLLKHYLQNKVNKADGTLTFPVRNPPFILHTRIAGDGEGNMVGMHLPRATIDEAQIFPMRAFTQLMPAINTWEPNTQQLHAGVPSGLRTSVLYYLDQKSDKYKKYRIPAHNNPYYTREDDIDNIKRYGGENTDEYLQLVLGRHGAAAFQVLSRDDIKTEAFDFYSFRFSNADKNKGQTYQSALQRPDTPSSLQAIVAAIDTGFVDPTIVSILGLDARGIWRTYVRYRLTRIDFPEQEKFIDWLDDVYRFTKIGIDIGPGGNGASILQGLMTRDDYRSKRYKDRVYGYNNTEHIVIGTNEHGEEIKQDAKGVATELLVKNLQTKRIVFSELDIEAIAELEKLAKQKGVSGIDRYFILSDTGKSRGNEDHVYASYVVFSLLTREPMITKRKKKLGTGTGVTS